MAQLTAAFGGPRWMDERQYRFIEEWEVESYRQTVAGGGRGGRMRGRVVLVTGGAQGFGLGIAHALAHEQAMVVLADMNVDGAQQAADAINREHGADTATAVGVNVTDEQEIGRAHV
mgnify:FL=1